MLTICSVEEFVKAIGMIRKDWFGEPPEEKAYLVPWCRGQEKTGWKLIPKFYRERRQETDHQKKSSKELEPVLLESEIREEFCRRAPALADYGKPNEKRELNEWEWYFVMQHHGAPTRLLDWTESALAGLYFAVRATSKNDCNAAVWVLNPWKLNKRAKLTFEVIPPSDPGTDTKSRKKLDRWLPHRFEKHRAGRVGVGKTQPVAIYLVHTMRRIGAQRLCFTIHGTEKDGFKEFEQYQDVLRKIEVLGSKTEDIRRSLKPAGLMKSPSTQIWTDLAER